ncbi:MAG: cyclase [Anaerolineae bacterium]|nr:cyclase [Anaerolineae bacterium]MDW8098428.1 cyclase [Anaerolineae bacterium]
MPVFEYTFAVPASLEAVRAIYHDTRALKKLTPPPIFVQIHNYEPLDEGAKAEFTLWLGPLPLRWVAIHSDVSKHGFTDTQVQGPLARWRHVHRFIPVDARHTRISEYIEYEHKPGPWGWFTRLLFSKLGLWTLFTARRILTRWYLAKAGLR